MRRLAALVLAGLAGPLAAQDLAIDGHLIDRCLPIRDDPMTCVGMQADACVTRNGGGADMILAACLGAEAAFWDGALNEAYADLQRLARDRQAQDLGYGPDALVLALRDMQRAWIGYRDARCANAAAIAAPFGSAAGPASAECLMTETARQYFVLRGMRRDYIE